MDNGELVVDDLVRELAVSRSVFFKKLKKLTGLAPIEFIKEIRIKRATHGKAVRRRAARRGCRPRARRMRSVRLRNTCGRS